MYLLYTLVYWFGGILLAEANIYNEVVRILGGEGDKKVRSNTEQYGSEGGGRGRLIQILIHKKRKFFNFTIGIVCFMLEEER